MIALSHRCAVGVKVAPPLRRLIHHVLSRSYTTAGAAALPQLDPDYLEQPSNRLGKAPMADEDGSFCRRGVQWAFIGCPLAKKRVFAETLSKLLGVPCISMESLVRQELSPSSSLYKQIANAVNQGEIVPEDIIFGLLSKRLEDGYVEGENGFILDGFPRSRLQAEILDQVAEIDLVVNFKCTDDYFMNHQQESAWKDKLRAYNEQLKPLLDYYQRQEKILDFQIRKAPWETWQGLLAALHLQHINAFTSRKLTAKSSFL